MGRKYTEEHYKAIVMEIALLSRYIGDGVTVDQAKAFAFIINHLCAILVHELTFDEFHDEIAKYGASENMREYYYKLLF